MHAIDKKICLITGASSGIGKEAALALAKLGVHVILVCRNAVKGEEVLTEIKTKAGSQQVDLLITDLSSQSEIRKLADIIYSHYARLDILINNAGLVLRKKQDSKDGIEMTLATNHLGPFLLTNLLLDLLKKSAPARIINVSSAIHKWASINLEDLQFEKRKYQFMKAYAQSKLLMNTTSFELARRLEADHVTVNCLHPGAVKSNLGSDSATNWFLKLTNKVIKSFFISPEQAAKALVYLATDSTIEKVSGKYFEKYKIVKAKTVSKQTSEEVWKISKEMTVT